MQVALTHAEIGEACGIFAARKARAAGAAAFPTGTSFETQVAYAASDSDELMASVTFTLPPSKDAGTDL